MTPEEAREVGLAKMAEIKAPPPPAVEASKTLGNAIRIDMRSRKSRLKPNSLKRYELSDRIILEYFGADKKVSEIKPDEISSFVLHRQQSVKNETINKDLARLRMVLKWAEDEDWVSKSPMRRVKQLRQKDGRTRYLLPEEVQRLWSVCCPWLWRLIWFAAMTGLRQGEQFGLRWSQVIDGQLRLRGDETKGGRPRVIPILPEVADILDSVRGDHKELVFVTEATKVKIHPSNFARDYWRPALKAAKISDFRWHDLRHTFCSWVVQNGGRLEPLQLLAGHEDFRTTQNYAHLGPEHLVGTIGVVGCRMRHLGVTPIGSAASKHKASSVK